MDEFDKALEEAWLAHEVGFGFILGARWAKEWIYAKHRLYEDHRVIEEKLRTENQRLREALEKFEVFGSDDCRNYMAGKCNGRITLYSVEDRLCVTCQKQAPSGEVSE